MKLYYNPQSRAVIVKWMLDKCGAKYEIVPVDFAKREHKTPEFLKINPAGKLPALVDGDTKVFENGISATNFRKQTSLPKSAPRNAAAISR